MKKFTRCCVFLLININFLYTAWLFPVPAMEQLSVKALNEARVEQALGNIDNYDPNKLIVYYKNSDKPVVVKVDQNERARFDVNKFYAADPGALEQQKQKLEDKYVQLLNDPNVERVQPQYIYTAEAWTRSGDTDTPDDFDLSPSALTGNHWYYERSKVRQMWQDQDCQNAGVNCGGNPSITIAVIDTGLAYETRTSELGDDFVANNDMFGGSNINLYVNAAETPNNQIDDDGNGYIDDYNGLNTAEFIYCTYISSCTTAEMAETGHANDDGGHGTYVTGLIASLVDNTAGSISPGFNFTIMPIKASFFHAGSFGTLEILEGIDYAIANGADVINMSLAGPAYDPSLEAKIEEATDAGIIVVAASGNTNSGVHYPAAFEEVIAVGAAKPDGTKAFYSNYGPELDVSAYVGNGAGVGDTVFQRSYTCFFQNPNCYTTPDYTTFSDGYGIGTSYASPQVAALAGMLKLAKPTITNQGVRNYIFGKAIDVETSGYDQNTGWGVINFEASYSGVANNVAPTISVGRTEGIVELSGNNYTIEWTDSDPDDNAQIDFFLDSDSSGFDGSAISSCTNISENNANSCSFVSVSPIAAGSYVYACITDEVNAVVCDYGNEVTMKPGSPVYRFFNLKTKIHFFTISNNEKNKLLADPATWVYEGRAYNAFKNQITGTSPVYRFQNNLSESHFYTISENEKNNIINNLQGSFLYEGVAYYTYKSQKPHTRAVFRFFKPEEKSHLFTNSTTERDKVINTLSHLYTYEGIAFYAIK